MFLVPYLGLSAALPQMTPLIAAHRARNPLLTLRSLASTIPGAGTVVAICAAAASTSALGMTAAVLAPHYPPLHLGLMFVPELGGAMLTSALR